MSEILYDFVLQGGLIVDGTGAPGFNGDVLVRNGVVADIERGGFVEPPLQETAVVDCRGKVVTPGFVDLHSHMDALAIEGDPRAFDSFTKQGVTSFVGGNCGFSSFAYKAGGPHQSLIGAGLFGGEEDTVGVKGYNYFNTRVEQNPVPHKVESLAGHGTCRTSVIGHEPRLLTPDESDEMLTILDQAMEEGAPGVSLGLQYKPGIFARYDELKAVAKRVKARDKVLTVHARAYSCFSGTYPMNPFGRDHNLRAVDDMIQLARETDVKLQFSHFIFVGSRTWPNVEEAIKLFDDAIAEGVDIKFDMFSYPCGATTLSTFLPEWFVAKMPQSLDNKADLMRLRLELLAGFALVGFGYGDMQVTHTACREYEAYDGLFLPEIARRIGKTEFQTVIDILRCSNASARVLNHSYYNQPIIERLMAHPAAIFATDAWTEAGGTKNPAAYSNFPRFLELARDKNIISLEEAVHKMTGAAVARIPVEGRGILKQGSVADITVFDPDAISTSSTLESPNAEPTGIEQVYIGGRAMLDQGGVCH